MTQHELLIAESATSLLRVSVKEQPKVYGDTAKKLAGQLRDRTRVTQEAVDITRYEASYDPRARYVVTEADRLVSEAEHQAERLDEHGRYTGQLRSQMSDNEKADYIRQHGSEKYLALPW